jgi:hypothetical protein
METIDENWVQTGDGRIAVNVQTLRGWDMEAHIHFQIETLFAEPVVRNTLSWFDVYNRDNSLNTADIRLIQGKLQYLRAYNLRRFNTREDNSKVYVRLHKPQTEGIHGSMDLAGVIINCIDDTEETAYLSSDTE